ncbi:hypothetical protein [Desulfallas thermosapovorans]|uniref:Uncharacterized protein n=1 Tax=Desulfallas thermosapovorans DSM 6562 TaxID=1121431 RepID=A0A5S4ZSA3_9FIRM|nr:hypothetical protein [Desulfallas thermosapovorans]TYO95528.1 hypothetical protein LX24_01489 [Desulfallas thermosapovorans DSM 6562]
MKIGAGGLQSQLMEDAIKIRQVDPSRNKPGQDNHIPFDPLQGRKKAGQELHPPLNEPAKGAAADNFSEHMRPTVEPEPSTPGGAPPAYQSLGMFVDVYI